MSNSLRPHRLPPAGLLYPWDVPGKNIGVGCHFLFQGIFLTQGSNPRLLHPLRWQADSLSLLYPSYKKRREDRMKTEAEDLPGGTVDKTLPAIPDPMIA